MTQEHPITPPDYLVKEWSSMNWQQGSQAAFADAARWGADQELEACCEWLNREVGTGWGHGTKLRAARRPKLPSLKEQALEALKYTEEGWRPIPEDCALIRRALESLPD